MQELIQKLEAALLKRNPLIATRLQKGLKPDRIRKDLDKAGIAGAIEPLIELYSWHNGAELQGEPDNGLKAGFAPPTIRPLTDGHKAFLAQYGIKRDTDTISYHFLRLRTAIISMKGFVDSARHNPRMAPLVGRYFPFLWNGSTWHLALDISPAGRGELVTIQPQTTEDPHLLRAAYGLFEEFLTDAIRANEENRPLSCITAPGAPIEG